MAYSVTLSLRMLLLGLGLWAYHVAAASSAGCAQAKTVKVGQTTNVTLDGRWYLLYFPVQYKPTSPAPLILSYHGGNRNASEQQSLDLLSTPFFNEDYIVVYPNGIDVSLLLSFSRLLSSLLFFFRKDGRACPA